MSDLIERLRGRANGFQRRHGGTDGLDYYSVRDAQCEIEAADALAERDAEIEAMREALGNLCKIAKPDSLLHFDWVKEANALIEVQPTGESDPTTNTGDRHMTQSKAMEAAARAASEWRHHVAQSDGTAVTASDRTTARQCIRAFIAKLHENTDPDETARYCLLGQLRREISEEPSAV